MNSRKPQATYLPGHFSLEAEFRQQVESMVKGWLLEGQRERRERFHRWELGRGSAALWTAVHISPNMTVAEVVLALLTLPPDVVLGSQIIRGLAETSTHPSDTKPVRIPILAVHGVPGNLKVEAENAASEGRIQAPQHEPRQNA